jgi:hypothetical protein
MYLLQEREFARAGRPVYKVGRTDRDVFERFKEYPKGSTMMYCERVQRASVRRIEAEVLRRFRGRFRARQDVGAETFEGPWEEMASTVREVIEDDRMAGHVEADVARRAGCTAAEYDALMTRFAAEVERRYRGELVPIETIELDYDEFARQASSSCTTSSTLLRDPFLRACREIGAAPVERLSVQFRAPGKNAFLDAAMHFRSFAMGSN